MNVSEAVQRRGSIRSFKSDTPLAGVVRDILERAARASFETWAEIEP